MKYDYSAILFLFLFVFGCGGVIIEGGLTLEEAEIDNRSDAELADSILTHCSRITGDHNEADFDFYYEKYADVSCGGIDLFRETRKYLTHNDSLVSVDTVYKIGDL